MSQRKAVTAVIAQRYQRASKAKKGLIRDELCATTGWHRSHARNQRAQRSPGVTSDAKATLAATYADLNPAALRRKIQALSFELLVLTKTKRGARPQPRLPARPKRASTDEATTQATRAS